jgi:hypothetical protein
VEEAEGRALEVAEESAGNPVGRQALRTGQQIEGLHAAYLCIDIRKGYSRKEDYGEKRYAHL